MLVGLLKIARNPGQIWKSVWVGISNSFVNDFSWLRSAKLQNRSCLVGMATSWDRCLSKIEKFQFFNCALTVAKFLDLISHWNTKAGSFYGFLTKRHSNFLCMRHERTFWPVYLHCKHTFYSKMVDSRESFKKWKFQCTGTERCLRYTWKLQQKIIWNST